MERAVLLSDPTPEFTANTAQVFKVRLAEPMTFQDDWEVALAALSIPDVTRAWGLNSQVMFSTMFTVKETGQAPRSFRKDLTTEEMHRHALITTGSQLMRTMVYAMDAFMFKHIQDAGVRIREYLRPTFLIHPDLMSTQAKNLHEIRSSSPERLNMFLKVNTRLAVGMKWLIEQWNPRNGQMEYDLGPNLYFTLPVDRGTLVPIANTEIGARDLWKEENGMLQLSLTVNWQFSNLDQAFAEFAGSPSKRLFVYCDLVESNRMGGQLHPLMREVYFRKNGWGTQYFEPQHYQWMPLRRAWVDTVEVELADPDGTLPEFAKGQTVLTVLFRKVTV